MLDFLGILRELLDAGPSVDGTGLYLQHGRHRHVVVHPGVLERDFPFRRGAHKGPLGEASTPLRVRAGKLLRQPHRPAEAAVQGLPVGDLDRPSQLLDGRYQHVDGGAEQVSSSAIFFECFFWILAQHYVVYVEL